MTDEVTQIDPVQFVDRNGSREVYEVVPSVTGTDSVPPVVDNISPASGSSILPTGTVSFDVTDETSLAYHAVFAYYPSTGDYDVVFDGDSFTQRYIGSGRVAIANGFRYTLARSSGWQASPTIRVRAVDGGGNTV